MKQEVFVFYWAKSDVKFIGLRHFNLQDLVRFVYLTALSVAQFVITKQGLYPLDHDFRSVIIIIVVE
jgi:hypothetical protein